MYKSAAALLLALALATGPAFPAAAQDSALDGAKIKEALKKSEAAYFKNKKILDEIADRSNDDISFIKKAYKLLLKREATDSELTGWAGRIGSGTSRLQAIDELTSSDEYFLKNEVSGFVKSGSARLMQSPGFESTSVMRIKKEEKFKILSRQDEWYNISLEGGARGYIRSENIAITPPDLSGGAAGDDAGPDGMEYLENDDLQNFRRVYAADIAGLKECFARLKSALAVGQKYRPFEIKPGKLIEGEKQLTLFRSKTLDMRKKIENYNSKNPIKHRIAVVSCGYDDVASYRFAESLIELQASAINGVAVRVLKNGESLIKSRAFTCPDEQRSRVALNDFKQECDYRGMKKYAIVDILNLGKHYFDAKKEYFMKNAFGEYSSAVEKDRYFADFTNPEATALMFGYLEDVMSSGYFDAVIIDNLKMPNYPAAGNDIRALFIFNDAPVKEFEKNTGVSVGSLGEAHEDIFKKFAISKFETFVSALRKFFASKKAPFYAICDADYYQRKFDTRLCEYKRWGSNIDMIFFRFPEADEKKIAALTKEAAAQVSRPQTVCVSRRSFGGDEQAFNFSDTLKKLNMENNLIRGLFVEP